MPPVHLNRYHHFTRLMRDPGIECVVSRYRSDFDGSMQSLMTLRPAAKRPERLFFFCHGMDGDCGDVVVAQDLVRDLDAEVVCGGGRGPAWVSDAFLADTAATVARHPRSSSGFYLMGVSMGATQCLALAGLLPRELRANLRGVFAFIPACDLAHTAEASSHPRVRDTLGASAGADCRRTRGPIHLIAQYPRKLPFVVLYNGADTILLADDTRRFVERLRSDGHPVMVYAAPGEHEFTYTDFDYAAVFRALGTSSDNAGFPPRYGSG